jgi:hypothetical protein
MLPTPVEVWVGGSPAAVSFAGRGTYPGVDQIMFTVPNDAPLGCYVPVQVRTEGKFPSNTTTLAISADGSPCSDGTDPVSAAAASAAAAPSLGLGVALVLRRGLQLGVSQFGLDTTLFFAHSVTGGDHFFHPLLSLPPPGSCTTYAYDMEDLRGLIAPGRRLDTGLPGPGITADAPGALNFLLGDFTQLALGHPLPDQEAVTAPRGADTGPFQVTIMPPTPLAWSNHGASISWDPAATADPVLIAGSSADAPSNAAAVFLCMASGPGGSFTAAEWITAVLPASNGIEATPYGWLFAGVWPLSSASTFQTDGLDLGVTIAPSGTAVTTTFTIAK